MEAAGDTLWGVDVGKALPLERDNELEFPGWDEGSWGNLRISFEAAAAGPSVVALGMELRSQMRHRAPVMLLLSRIVSLAL